MVYFFMPRYFAVFQGTTYEEEKALSCLWAPKFGQNGQEFHHHKRLIEVDTGDRVIHLVKKKIVAISTVKAKAYDAEAPRLKDEKKPWLKDGRKVDIEIIELDDPINTDSIFDRIKDFLPENLKPFLDKDSPIKDLFPEPCIKCIEWKKKLREIIKPDDDAPEKEFTEYKNLLSTTSVAYSDHIKEYHTNTELPIKRLENIFV